MRESIGNSLLLSIAIVFIGIIIAFMIGSIAYSKAYKSKNRIISTIEKYDGKCFDSSVGDECFMEIENELSDMGYSSNISSDCPDYSMDVIDMKNSGIASIDKVYPVNDDSGHKYCVYKYRLCDVVQMGSSQIGCSYSNESHYYKVVTFMHFDIPIIEHFLEFKVTGETKIFYDKFINIKTSY